MLGKIGSTTPEDNSFLNRMSAEDKSTTDGEKDIVIMENVAITSQLHCISNQFNFDAVLDLTCNDINNCNQQETEHSRQCQKNNYF